MQETEKQSIFNEVIDRFVKIYKFYPIFKCYETPYGIKAELYTKDIDIPNENKQVIVGPVCIGFFNTTSPTNDDYIDAMITSIANFDSMITNFQYIVPDKD